MNRQLNKSIRLGIIGLFLGFSLSQIGFSDYDELHKMFVFADLRMLFAFIAGLAITSVIFVIKKYKINRPLHKGNVVGGILFGIGWAISGGCPSIPLIQLGEGKMLAVFSLFGIIAGILLHRHVQSRYLKWPRTSCAD